MTKIRGWRTRSLFERHVIGDQNIIAAAMKKLQASAEKSGNRYNSVAVERESVAVAKAPIVN